MAFPDGYERKCELVIQASQVDADLTDFPVLLTEANLPSEMFDADGPYPAEDGGGDIRFSLDADGQTQLPCEIEEFTTNNDPSLGKAAIWVKIPSVSSSSNTSFYVWYHNPTCDPEQPLADDPYGSENVWDSSFVGVWHLNQDPSGGSSCIKDSTANANHGTPQGSMTSSDLVDGKVSKAISFDGSNDYIVIPNSPSLDISGPLTIEALASLDELKYQGLVSKYQSVNANGYFLRTLEASPNDKVEGGYDDKIDSSTSISTSTWYGFAVTEDSSKNAEIFLDGASDNTASFSDFPSSNSDDLTIGTDYTPDTNARCFHGILDEVRISNVARSAGWIKTSFNSMNDPGSFISPGSPQEGQPFTVTLDWSSFDPVLDLLKETVSLCLISLFGHGLHVFYTDRALFQEVENILHSRIKNLPSEDQSLGLKLLDFYRRFYTR